MNRLSPQPSPASCLLRAAAPALVLLALGSYAAVGAQAPMEPPGRVDPTTLTGGLYKADPAHSLVGWRVNHLGFNDYFGIFGGVEGTLRLDPKAPGKAVVEVSVPVAGVLVANPALRDHLLRPGKDGGEPDFFGAAPKPARFVSTGVSVSPGGLTAEVTGRLTLNGVTRPVKLYVRFTGAGPAPMTQAETVGFEGRTTIKRSDFGLGFGVPMVSDEVELELTAAFEKGGAPAARPARDACNAAAAADAIGRKDTPALRTEVTRKVGHSRIRWLPPGAIVTQDLRSDRLNVDIDAGGVVVRTRCG